MDLVFMLMIAAEDYWTNLEPYWRGYAAGYITFEIVLTIVAAAVTAEAAGAGALVTLCRHCPKILKTMMAARKYVVRLQNAAPDLAGIVNVFDPVIMWLWDATKAGKWCLIAATPVMTMAGPLPVEQIEPGMMVLSAPEFGAGAPSFRPVAGLSRNRVPCHAE